MESATAQITTTAYNIDSAKVIGSATANAPESASAPGREATPGYETAPDDAPASEFDMDSSTMVHDAAPSGAPASEIHLLDAPEESLGANVPYAPAIEVQLEFKVLIAASEVDAISATAVGYAHAPAPEKDVLCIQIGLINM